MFYVAIQALLAQLATSAHVTWGHSMLPAHWHGTLSSYNTLSSSTLSMVGAACLIPGYDSAADAIVRLLIQVQVQLPMIGFGCFNVCHETKCFPYCWRLLGVQQSCTRQCIHFNLELSSEQSINQHEPRSTPLLPPLRAPPPFPSSASPLPLDPAKQVGSRPTPWPSLFCSTASSPAGVLSALLHEASTLLTSIW